MATQTGDSVLIFEEISGPKSERRRIYLRGSTAAMGGPRRDAAFKLGGDLRQSKQAEPGVRAPVRHITGTTENDIEIHGHLRDSLLSTDGEADDLQEKIDDIRKQGKRIGVHWMNKYRVGVLVHAEFGIEGWRDRTYLLRFEIDGDVEEEATARRRAARVAFPPADTAGLFDDLQTKLAAIKVPGLRIDVEGWLTELYAGIANPIGRLLGALEDIEADIDDVSSALRSIAQSARALLGRLQQLAATLDAETDPTDLDDAGSLAAWQRRRAEALVALQQAAKRAYDLGVEAEKRLEGSTAGHVHVVKAGETVEQIAAREGTTPEKIWALNPGLPLMPPPGTRVKLP